MKLSDLPGLSAEEKKIAERVDRATPEPWRWSGFYLLQDVPDRKDPSRREDNPFATPCGYHIACDGSAGGEYSATISVGGPDAGLIEHAPTDLRTLLETVSKQREALQIIAEWPFDIMSDCVADARKVARKALG